MCSDLDHGQASGWQRQCDHTSKSPIASLLNRGVAERVSLLVLQVDCEKTKNQQHGAGAFATQVRLRSGGKKEFVEAIECNKISLRQAYARAFSLWNYLHAMFLYSALMMTELFYRTSGLPSLLEEQSNSTNQGQVA